MLPQEIIYKITSYLLITDAHTIYLLCGFKEYSRRLHNFLIDNPIVFHKYSCGVCGISCVLRDNSVLKIKLICCNRLSCRSRCCSVFCWWCRRPTCHDCLDGKDNCYFGCGAAYE